MIQIVVENLFMFWMQLNLTFEIMKNKDLNNKIVTITGSETILMKDLFIVNFRNFKINNKITFVRRNIRGIIKNYSVSKKFRL